jgi:hypothetical protein
MAARVKKPASAPVRQSVTMPAALASEIRRVAKERHVTVSRALVALAARGIAAEAEAQTQLTLSYQRFLEQEPSNRNEAGQDLIRAIFGKAAIADDSVR